MTTEHNTTWDSLTDMITNQVYPVVRFVKSKILDVEIETYFEPQMMAKLITVDSQHDSSICLTFDVRDFHTYNQALESHMYYDSKQQPTLTASQAGYSPEKTNFTETVYVMPEWPVESLFTIVDDKSIVLYELYINNKAEQQTYINWLEQQLWQYKIDAVESELLTRSPKTLIA